MPTDYRPLPGDGCLSPPLTKNGVDLADAWRYASLNLHQLVDTAQLASPSGGLMERLRQSLAQNKKPVSRAKSARRAPATKAKSHGKKKTSRAA